MYMLKAAKCLLAVFITWTCSACQRSNISCSDSSILQTVNEILTDEIKREIFIAAFFDMENSKFDISAIRTQSADQRFAICSATVRPLFKRAVVKGGSQEEAAGGNYVANSALLKMAGEITYKAELTDDAKEYIVNVRWH